MKYTKSMHTDQYDANVVSPVVNSGDKAEWKNDKAGGNSHDESIKRIPKNPENFSTSKQVM